MAANTPSENSDKDLQQSDTVNLYKLYGGALGGNTVVKNADTDADTFEFDNNRGGRDVSNVRMKEPMSSLFNYFEYEILEPGQSTAIGIGVGHSEYPLTRMPGWNTNSIGYHADDGKMFHQAGYGTNFGPRCKKGDRMGVGVDFETPCGEGKVKVWFTRNGEMVGGRSLEVNRPVKGLYPLIGLHSQGERVRYLGHSYHPPNTGDGVGPVMLVDNSHPLTYWSRCNGIVFTNSPLCLSFKGANRGDVALIISSWLVTPASHYFEILIEDGGRDSAIGIGVGPQKYPSDSYPGWRKGSIGFHADNGNLYKEKGSGVKFGSKCTTGDTMGCGVIFPHDSLAIDCVATDDDDNSGRKSYISGPFPDCTQEGLKCVVFFTLNGKELGREDFQIPKGGLYPMIGMSSPGEQILVTFEALSG